jgi:hypothetical protein
MTINVVWAHFIIVVVLAPYPSHSCLLFVVPHPIVPHYQLRAPSSLSLLLPSPPSLHCSLFPLHKQLLVAAAVWGAVVVVVVAVVIVMVVTSL